VALAAVLIILSWTGSSVDRSSPSLVVSGTSKGSPEAPVTIVDYSDFQCHFCQLFTRTAGRELEKAYIQTGKVRLEYKHFPILGEESVLAALASECAAEQGQFWPYHDLLMAAQADPREDDLTLGRLRGLARDLNLNLEDFDACLVSVRYLEKIKQDFEEGKALGVRGTPTFFINGKKVVGAQPFATFQRIIEGLLGESNN
jgi:protein-disulfide isomerase